MAIDPKKMRQLFLSTSPDWIGGNDDQAHDGDEDVTGGDPHSVVLRASDDQVHRLMLPEISYMEIRSRAGGFSCGTCTWANKVMVECIHPQVMSPVSPGHGCCNLWKGRQGKMVFPLLDVAH